MSRNNQIIYRRNFTQECFYRIDMGSLALEVVYDFEEDHPQLDSMPCSEQFARSLADGLYEIPPQQYYDLRALAGLAMV